MKQATSTSQTANKAFSLIEMIIVTIVIFLAYSIVASSLTFKPKTLSTIDNLKSNMLNQKFSRSCELVCLKSPNECFYVLDNEPLEERFVLFDESMVAYRWDGDRVEEISEFEPIDIEGFSTPTRLRYSITKERQNEIILFANNLYYLFEAIASAPKVFETIEAVEDYNTDKQNELEDALHAI